MKYLVLNDDWVIRGTKEIPRLFNWKTGKVIKLNNKVLKYILKCTGESSLEEIASEFGESLEAANQFFGQFIEIQVINEVDSACCKKIDMGLGLKEPWLKEVHLDVTNNCNLRCQHCFWGENISYDSNISSQKWTDLLFQLKGMGVGKIVISGGEAFTRKDLIHIVKSCFECKLYLGAIFTNGTINTVETKKIIDFIIENKLKTSFYISLDGYKKEQHDFIRGEGKFKQTLEFINELVQRKKQENAVYRIMVNSLIHKKNYKELIEWYDFLEEIGVDSWRFTTGRISGSLLKNKANIVVEREDYFPKYAELTRYVIQKYKKGNCLSVNIENYFNTKYFDRGRIELFDEEYSICDYKANACSIDPKGNVQFCTGWQNKKYGNVFEKSPEEIWYSDELQSIKSFKIKDIIGCKECSYLKYCGGGCRLECSSLTEKDDSVCENFRFFDELIVPIISQENIKFVGIQG